MTKTAETMNEAEEFLTPAEAQKILRCGKSCIYTALANGEIPYVRVGKLIRIPRASLTPEVSASVRRDHTRS